MAACRVNDLPGSNLIDCDGVEATLLLNCSAEDGPTWTYDDTGTALEDEVTVDGGTVVPSTGDYIITAEGAQGADP